MTLSRETLKKYFEKSERLNMLQFRINTYASLLKKKYLDLCNEKFRTLSTDEKARYASGLSHRIAKMKILDATLKFHWDDDNGANPTYYPSFEFELVMDDRFYNLAEQRLPARFIEPMYDALPLLTVLMRRANPALAISIEDEVLDYLQ